MDVFRRAVQLLDAGEALALVTVVATSGSTPRHPGARMLVREGRGIVGTIGGGRIELAAIDAAGDVLRGGAPRRLRHHLTRDLAMCCGGTMEVYVEAAGPSRAALVEVVAAREARRACTLITPLDGGPKSVEVAATPTARSPRVVGDRFLEPIVPADRVVLFGGGHVARAIGPLAAGVGFAVVVCDDGDVGEELAAPPWASRWIDSFEVPEVERAIGALGAGDYVVIVTRDHAIDQRVLERLLANDRLAYLGLIGSQGKLARFRMRLDAKGVGGPAAWERLRCPVGLDIGAETPAEIAVAIVAELIRERSR